MAMTNDRKVILSVEDNEDIASLIRLVLRHAPDFDAAGMEMRPSAKGNYMSLTCTIRAVSREQLDALYRELSAHPLVKVVL